MRTILVWAALIFMIGAPGVQASEIHQAAEEGDLSRVKILLSESPELLDAKDDEGKTPLLAAAAAGKKEIIQFLLGSGADLAAVSSRGSTVLHMAAYEGHVDAAEYLIKQDLDINAVNNGGFSPLMHAAYKGHVDVAELLVDRGADMSVTDGRWGGTAFHWACSRGNAGVLEILLKHGADLHTPSVTDSSTPIFWATNSGNMETLQFLLDRGVSPQEVMPEGWTPLHNAVRGGHLEAVRLLLDKGASINTADNEGVTPFLAAAEADQMEMAKFLVDRGANANAAYASGLTALHWATIRGNLVMTEFLLSQGCDANARDEFGTTPLDRTVYSGQVNLAALLIDHGAVVNTHNEDGETPLKRAIIHGHDNLAELFITNGAEIDFRDHRHNRTSLHWAAIKGRKAAADLLIEHGAEIDAVDQAGHTPLYYAGKYGHTDVAARLVSAGAGDTDEKFSPSASLKQEYADGQAAVWYLGHCGFAVKTQKHLLIFDYWNQGADPGLPSLANGHINPAEIADENVYVFATHEHADHFDSSIFAWAESVKNINYIYGFKPEDLPAYRDSGYSGPGYEYIGPRERKTIGNMDIVTIAANDAGVGFFVEVDGVKLYHAGDHAGWREGERDGYIGEIDYLAEQTSDIDFAFVNVTGCHVQDTLALAEGTEYTLQKLRPTYWFPTHGIDREYVYGQFAEKAEDWGVTSRAVCAENRGDCFIPGAGQL